MPRTSSHRKNVGWPAGVSFSSTGHLHTATSLGQALTACLGERHAQASGLLQRQQGLHELRAVPVCMTLRWSYLCNIGRASGDAVVQRIASSINRPGATALVGHPPPSTRREGAHWLQTGGPAALGAAQCGWTRACKDHCMAGGREVGCGWRRSGAARGRRLRVLHVRGEGCACCLSRRSPAGLGC